MSEFEQARDREAVIEVVRSGRNTRLFAGGYEYVLARSDASWRITHFKFNLKFVDGNLALDREEQA